MATTLRNDSGLKMAMVKVKELIQNGAIMGDQPPPFLNEPPLSDRLTDYDKQHMTLYLRLLDASRSGADWREAVAILFGLDPQAEPHKCQHIHDSHLARARWMTEHGYRELVRLSQVSK